MMKSAWLAAAALAFCGSAAAKPVTVDEAIAVLRAAGASELVATSGSQPGELGVDGAIDDTEFSITFLDCDAGRCGGAIFYSVFDLGGLADGEHYEAANAYNLSEPFGRAFVGPSDTPGQAVIGVDYAMRFDGGAAFDADDVAIWRGVLDVFLTGMFDGAPNNG